MRLPTVVTQLHKWVGLVIGIQVILWVAGGVVMSWFPLERVRGEHNIAEAPPETVNPDAKLVPIQSILQSLDGEAAVSVALRHLLGEPVFEVALVDGPSRLYNASDGALLTPLPEDVARRIALADFSGQARVASARLIEEHNLEYRGDTPVWQVMLDDEEVTHLYVSPDSGRVVARRNGVWRLYDFFWMLHIMDYSGRVDFNHPLIIIASIVALALSVTGGVLIFYRFSKGDFRWLALGRRRRQAQYPEAGGDRSPTR